MTPEEARAIFGGIHKQMGAMQRLAEAMEADLDGGLSDDDLVAVVEEYLGSTRELENLRNTRGLIT